MSRPHTFKSKITLVVMATSGAALLLAILALLVDEYVSHRQDAARRLRIIAQIVATQSSAAVLFKDARAAEEILGSLRAAGAPRPLRVVDVGCGPGFVVRWLAARLP